MKRIIKCVIAVILIIANSNCNKQSISSSSECKTCGDFDYDAYIEQLAKETGIDIVSISHYPIVSEIAKYDEKNIKTSYSK